jgi:hypothetical protein
MIIIVELVLEYIKGETVPKNKKTHLSASAIKCFKACPLRFKGQYDLGIRKIEDTEALRIGTHWHEILEVADDWDAVTELLNERYGNIPDHMDKEKMETERIKLLYTLTGYNWFYQDVEREVIAAEIEFEITVRNPETGRSLPNVTIKGKLDKFIREGNRIFIKEHKSTSDPVDPDSRLWKKLNLDTQTTLYVYAARRLQVEGKLEQFGITKDDTIVGILYDCWHKPGISPKKLSQTDSKKFVAEGEYCDQAFDVQYDSQGDYDTLFVNGVNPEVEPGAKEGTFAIRETPEMYGARLLKDIVDRPEFYFHCKELTKTDQQMEKFEWELYNIYQTIKQMKKTGHWYGDESQCEATFTCDFIENCYNNKPIDLDNIPDKMHCIFGDKNNGCS